MTLEFQNPALLVFTLLIFPVAFYVKNQIKKYSGFVRYTYKEKNFKAKKTLSFKTRCNLRLLSWSLAWVCAFVALSGPSWGKKPIEVFKSGTAVVFVFDISYSMLAEDAFFIRTKVDRDVKKKVSRLDASTVFAQEVLKNVNGISIGAVLTKGDSFLAVPLTEDYYAVENLVRVLSPTLVSAPGSSIAKGIETATMAFPPQSARNSIIVVCTDGDETDNALAQAVQKATRYGISIIFLGFGSIHETPVTAGDGVTIVQTALREKQLVAAAKNQNCTYINAADSHSFTNVLAFLSEYINLPDASLKPVTSLKMVPVKRHSLFLTLAVFFLFMGFMFSELHIKKITTHSMHGFLLLSCCYLVLTSTGCTASFSDAAMVLNGRLKWVQHDYDTATAVFLTITNEAESRNNTELAQYGIYGLSTAYLMQNETKAALSRLESIAPDAPDSILFSSW
ncbi:MAG TPA: VWA domain-containing protein, partial [Treponemataceae bacterium]|nr:VWA domain-containing protein [Treponemataceae bacterium]